MRALGSKNIKHVPKAEKEAIEVENNFHKRFLELAKVETQKLKKMVIEKGNNCTKSKTLKELDGRVEDLVYS